MMEETRVSDNQARPAGGPLGEIGLSIVAEWEVVKAAPEAPETENEGDN